nr:phage tail length tape measure family protein [uncultured Albidiferax sp.]
MADQTERLRVIIELDGTAALSDGTKLSAQQVRDLGDHLAQTGKQAEAASAQIGKAGQSVASVGREMAQGDWRNAALEAGRLAAGSEAAGGGLVLMAGGVALATTALAAYTAIVVAAYLETQRQNDALLLTGNYAGLVGGQLNQMARESAAAINGSVANSRETMEGLVATGRVTSQSLASVAQAVQLVTQYSGKNREAVLSDFAGMADGVATWAAKHNQAYHFLNLEQYKYIESLEKAGKTQEAMQVTSEALSRHLGGDLTTNLGTLEKAWKGVGNWASRAWDAMLNVGREDTTADKIAKIKAQLDALATRKNTGRYTDDTRAELVANLQSQLQSAQETARMERRAADNKSQEAQANEAAIAAAREKPKTPKAERVDPEIEAQRRVLAELSGYSASYEKDVQRLAAMYDKGTLSTATYQRALQELLARQPFMREAAKAEAEALREATKNREAAAAAATKDYEAREQEIAGLLKANSTLELQIESVGKTKGQIEALKAARLDHIIAMKQEDMAATMGFDTDGRATEQKQRLIDALIQERDLTAQLGQAQLADDQRKKNEADSKKFSDDLRRDLTDSLQRAFESGKNPAEALATTLANTVKTRLIRAIAESITNPWLKPLEGAINGLVSGFFGGGTTGAPVIDAPVDVQFAHTGGIAGGDGGWRSTVAQNVFGNAPKFHTGGLVGGEVPIIAKKGEGVFTAGQMAAIGAGMGSSQPVTVNVYPTSGQTASVQQTTTPGGGLQIDVMLRQVEEMLADNVNAGSGSLARSMEGRYGLRTAVN